MYHYERSDNNAKQREYLRKAAQAADEVSAFTTAVKYLARLVELTPAADPARAALALQLADAHYRFSDFPAARAAIEQAQAAATTDTDRASALALLGEMTSGMGDYAAAQTILAEAVPLARASGDQLTLCRALYALGDVNWRLGKLDNANVALNESLTLAREIGNVTRELFALNMLGVVAVDQKYWDEAEQRFTEVHSRAAAAGNRERAMVALNCLGADRRQNIVAAQAYTQQVLALAREIGAQQPIAVSIINLACSDIQFGQFTAARAKLREGLGLALRLGALPWVLTAMVNFAELTHAEG